MPGKDKSREFKEIEEKRIRPKLEKEVKRNKQNKLINVMNYLTERYEFRYNLFAAKPEYKNGKGNKYNFFDERAFDNLIMQVKVDGGIEISKDDFRSLVGCEKLSPDYDPIRQYIFSLSVWDTKDRFQEFLMRVQLKCEDVRQHFIKSFTKWFIAMVASIIDDAAYNENCLVLCGPQGIGKTRFLTSLVPEELRLYYTFTGNFRPHDKDHLEMLGTKLLILMDEMSTLTRTDIEIVKSTMSIRYINLRRAYGRAPIHLYRKASFCGSINEEEFLTDQTGNRRWLPFMIHEIDLSEDFDISLLYAQALAMIKNNFRTYFDKEEIQQLEKHNEVFRRIPMEEELLMKNYIPATQAEIDRGDPDIRYLTPSDIEHAIASRDEYRKKNVNDTSLKRLNSALKALGFKKIMKRIEGYPNPRRVYAVKLVDLFTKESNEKSECVENRFDL